MNRNPREPTVSRDSWAITDDQKEKGSTITLSPREGSGGSLDLREQWLDNLDNTQREVSHSKTTENHYGFTPLLNK